MTTTAPRLTALAFALALTACGEPEEPHHGKHEEPPATGEAPDVEAGRDVLRIDPEMLRDVRITTSGVEVRPGGEGVMALGQLGVNEERYAEVGSVIRARVTELLVGVGDAVVAGQPLAALDSVELGQAQAKLLAAKALADLARQTLARKRGLAAERIVPRREVEEAAAAAAAADAEWRAAEGALRALGATADEAGSGPADSTRFYVRAPLAGVVIERDAVQGRMVAPGRALFRVADLSLLWLTVHAFERDAVRVSLGAQARIALAALPGRSFTGIVTLVGRRVEPDSRTLPVRIDLPNEDGVLRPGMSASAWLPLGDEGTMLLAVPAASLQRLHDGWCVFVPRAAGAFDIRRVGRGRDLGGEVEVVAGLRPGELVVVEGAFLLKAEAEKGRGEGDHHEH